MIINRNYDYYEDEKLYSTGSNELDELLEKAFCDGYYYAQKEFNSPKQKLINNTLNLKRGGSRTPYIDANLISKNAAGKGAQAELRMGRLLSKETNIDPLELRAEHKSLVDTFTDDKDFNNKLYQKYLKDDIKSKKSEPRKIGIEVKKIINKFEREK